MKGYTYILECANGQYYVGSTTNIELRLLEHERGEGARFTKGQLPVKLLYVEEHDRIEDAFHRECQLHGWSRSKKEALMRGDSESLRSLSLSNENVDQPRNLTKNVTLE